MESPFTSLGHFKVLNILCVVGSSFTNEKTPCLLKYAHKEDLLVVQYVLRISCISNFFILLRPDGKSSISGFQLRKPALYRNKYLVSSEILSVHPLFFSTIMYIPNILKIKNCMHYTCGKIFNSLSVLKKYFLCGIIHPLWYCINFDCFFNLSLNEHSLYLFMLFMIYNLFLLPIQKPVESWGNSSSIRCIF